MWNQGRLSQTHFLFRNVGTDIALLSRQKNQQTAPPKPLGDKKVSYSFRPAIQRPSPRAARAASLPAMAVPSAMAAVLATALVPALAEAGRGFNDSAYPCAFFNWGQGWFGGPMMILVWIALIVGIVLVVRWLFAKDSRGDARTVSSANPSAREVLDTRYAKGEISRDEYVRLKADLAS